MRLDNLNELPEWKDEWKGDDDEGEEWKPNPTPEACKALYDKWSEILAMLRGALGTEDENSAEEEDADFDKRHRAMVLGDAFEVGVKIRSSETGGMYILRMENAAIIRKNAQFVKISMLGFMADGVISEEYCYIIRNEIDVFRKLFKEWVATFEKDAFEDEWGLFV